MVWLLTIGRLGSDRGKEHKDNDILSSMIGGHLKNCPFIFNLRRYNHMTHDLKITAMSLTK